MTDTPPNWLKTEISEGLKGLLALRLDGSPAADLSRRTRDAWLYALTDGVVWDEQLDTPRIRAAFRQLAANCTKWPPPKALRNAMPPRPQAKALEHVMSDERRAANKARLKALVDQLGMKPTTCLHKAHQRLNDG